MTAPDNQDTTKLFHNALIQHGPLSNRIYLMKLNNADAKTLIPAMTGLAEEKGYTKIFAKVPEFEAEAFLENNFAVEAEVPGFFHGREGCMFLTKYFDDQRQTEQQAKKLDKIISDSQSKQPTPAYLPAGFTIRKCTTADAIQMSEVYKEVFDSYPFPIDNPEYIAETMEDDFIYFCVDVNGTIAALSSSEMDVISKNVEMTDFATLPQFRGNSLANQLLAAMENEMRTLGILTAYTIARSISPAMNITFSKAGYRFAGRLKNNTNIAGNIESMNVWYKSL